MPENKQDTSLQKQDAPDFTSRGISSTPPHTYPHVANALNTHHDDNVYQDTNQRPQQLTQLRLPLFLLVTLTLLSAMEASERTITHRTKRQYIQNASRFLSTQKTVLKCS